MTRLAELQRVFAEGVLKGDDAALEPLVADDGRQGARLAVYRNNTFASLRSVLADAFPTVLAIVGDELFSRLSAAYVRHEPPTANHLNDYGATFTDFVARSEPLRPWPWLGDVTRLDWAVNAAYDAADAVTLKPTELAGLDATALMACRFRLVPAAVLVASDWPIHAIRMTPEIAVDPGSLEPRAQAVLVQRPEVRVETELLHPAAFAFLAAIAEGLELGEAAARSQAADPAFDLMQALAGYLTDGLFAARHNPEA